MRQTVNLAGCLNANLLKKFSFDGKNLFKSGKRVKSVSGGRLITTCQGNTLLAADVAWTLHFGYAPLYRLWKFDIEPYNIQISNLFPVRGNTLRCRIIKVQNGYQHSLSNVAWANIEDAKLAWRKQVRDNYQKDKEFCIAEGAKIRSDILVNVPEVKIDNSVVDIAPYIAGNDQKKRVYNLPANLKAHWYKNQWLVVNRAKFIGDDFHLRCEAAMRYLNGESNDWLSEPVKLFLASLSVN